MIKITFAICTALLFFTTVFQAHAIKVNKIKTIVITGKKFSFSPNKLTLQKGKRGKIIFKNIEGFHDFRVEGMKVATKVIKAGEETSVTFTPNKKGKFEFYCSVGNHRAMGMKGTLEVK